MKRYSLIVTLVLLIALVLIFFLFYLLTKPKKPQVTSALEILHSDQLTFLVTEKIVTQVVVNIDNSHWLTGTDKALLYTVVTMYYGVDLEKISETNITQSGDSIFIDIPDPEFLDMSVDLNNLQIYESRSGLTRLKDIIMSDNKTIELLGEFENAARILAQEQDMIPTREQILYQLNDFSPLFSSQLDCVIIFR